MFTNRKANLFIIGTLAVALIAVLALAVVPSAASPAVNTSSSTDYSQRHPELSNLSFVKAVGSDWYQRHTGELARAGVTDTSDYFLRH